MAQFRWATAWHSKAQHRCDGQGNGTAGRSNASPSTATAKQSGDWQCNDWHSNGTAWRGCASPGQARHSNGKVTAARHRGAGGGRQEGDMSMENVEKMRVRVTGGCGEESLGLGWFVGCATVYAFRGAGGLMTQSNPTQEPPSKLVAEMEAEGFHLVKIDDNPVIELDSGETVYGSQVWWEWEAQERGTTGAGGGTGS